MAATFLRKYGVAVSGSTVVSIPLVKAGVTNFAVSADYTPVSGDVMISRDGGGWGAISNLPIARSTGGNGSSAVWDFILTGTETNAAQTRVMISDAATKAIEDDYFIVEFFGNVSGIQQFDYTSGTSTNIWNSGLANTILSQSVRCVENSAPSGSLCEMTLGSLNSTVSDGNLNIMRSDRTNFSVKSLTTTPGAAPIRGIS